MSAPTGGWDAVHDAYPHRALLERDRELPVRVTLLADRVPREGSTTDRAAAMLSALDPPVRVTVAAPAIDPQGRAALEARGVEVVALPSPGEPARWLAARAGHPSVVIVDGPAAGLAFLGSLDAHPGAAIVYDARGPASGDHAVDRLAESQIVALASVVLVPSAGFVPFVRELSGGEAVVADPASASLALAQALALVGIAVPDAALV